ncbi:hypothetical protein DSLASN_30420 [Desulfoluna limicola]|uniref:MotA/TolQ/ExbB proton channel domain-containing protein n=1 Tax=Desulfoluna limicola TaxID=2810562 RepID=A0ABM7PJP2_9BACT|nr:hypothetical protein [Desulfoluna limicola]BCS97410.1 hypothetical protein DSLASN_30420 [Desulfoluna limicola]
MVIDVNGFVTSLVGTILSFLFPEIIDWNAMSRLNQWVISGFIILGLAAAVIFIFLYAIRLYTLRRANKRIECAIKQNHEPDDLREQLFGSKTWAHTLYTDYTRAWKAACPRNKNKAAFPVSLKDFIPSHQVVESCCYHKLALAMPGIFVSLGILGTFYGVMCGINNINPSNVEKLSQEIFVLIAGLKVAFMTSLIGITLSIFFTFVHRLLVEGIIRSYDKLNSLCFKYLCPCESEEESSRLVMEQLDEVNQSIKTMATDLATQLSDSLGPAIGTALGEHVVPAIEAMVEGMTNSAQQTKDHNETIARSIDQSIGGLGDVISRHLDNAQKRQEEVMDGVLKEYVENMNHTFKDLFDEMGRVVQETMQVQKDIHEGMTDFSSFVRGNFEKQEELLKSTTQAANVMADTIGQFESITSSVESTTKSLERTGDVVDRAAEKTKEIYDAVERAAEVAVGRVNAMQESMDETWETMSKRTEELIGGMEELISGQVTRIHESLDQTIGELGRTINESAGGMTEAWENIHKHADQLVTTLDGTTREFGDNIGQGLTKGLEIFDQKVAEVVERFSGTLHETKESITLLSPTLEKLTQGISGMQQEMGTQKEVLERLTEISEISVVPSVEKSHDAARMISESTMAISEASKELMGWVNVQEQFIHNLQTAIHDEKKEHVSALGEKLELFANEISPVLKERMVVDEKILNAMGEITSGDRDVVRYLEIQGGHLKRLEENFQSLGSKSQEAIGGYLNKMEQSFAAVTDLLEKAVAEGEHRNRFSLFGGGR